MEKITFNQKIVQIRNREMLKNNLTRIVIYSVSFIGLLLLFSLIGFVIYKSVYFFHNYGFFKFFSSSWSSSNNNFGVGRIIVASFFVLLLTLVIAIPLTIMSSLFIVEFLSPWWKSKIIGIIQLLAGIPSVVFGLFALSILGPLFLDLGAPTSTNLIITCITLAFMGLPIMVALSINAIESVPQTNRYGSLALGVSKQSTTMLIVLKSALPGIISGIFLGIARIIGETMAVLMICGNNPDGLHLNSGFLKFLYSAVATLASTIGLEILESVNNLHTSALYAIAVLLFTFVTIINLLVLLVQKRKRKKKLFHLRHRWSNTENVQIDTNIVKKIHHPSAFRSRYNQMKNWFWMFWLITCTFIAITFTLIVLGSVIYRGFAELHFSDLFSISTANGGAGLLSTFLVTLLLVVCAITIALPLALIIAIYLREYANPNFWMTKMIIFWLNILASTPSIVYGLFGLVLFIGLFHIPLSIFAAGLTVTLVILPMLIRNIEEGIGRVPAVLRASSLSLGVSKSKTIFKIILPNTLATITTSVILAIARVVGESAPIYLTLGTAVQFPTDGFFSPGAAMSTEILLLWKSGTSNDIFRIMYELALCIMILVLIMNFLANYAKKRLAPDYQKTTWKQKMDNLFWTIKSWNLSIFWKDQGNKKAKININEIKKIESKPDNAKD